jgi:hypothetical protein
VSDAKKILIDNGYEDIIYLTNFSYDTALIGVSHDNRAIYDFNKMVDWLIETQNFTQEESVEWIEYNTIRALSYVNGDTPIIMYPLIKETEEEF